MEGGKKRMGVKRIIMLMIVITLGVTFVFLGVFFINYTSDEITSISQDAYYELEWETHRPYEGLGQILLGIGVILLVLAVLFTLKWVYKNPDNRKL